MIYTIGMVLLFIEANLGVSTYFDFGTRIFSTQWSQFGAHILQGLWQYYHSDYDLLQCALLALFPLKIFLMDKKGGGS